MHIDNAEMPRICTLDEPNDSTPHTHETPDPHQDPHIDEVPNPKPETPTQLTLTDVINNVWCIFSVYKRR